MSVLGPLTSTFTPPAICASEAQNVYHTDYWFFQGPTETSCFPEGYDPDRTAFFSPAAACPSGYTTACSSINTLAQPQETVVTCCPNFVESRSFECAATVSLDIQQTYACSSSLPYSWTLTDISHISNGSTVLVPTWTGIQGGGFNAYGVQIRAQATATEAISGGGSRSTSSSTPGSSGSGPAESTAGSSSSSSGDEGQTGAAGGGGGSGLTTGAVAGLAVGCALAGILLAVAVMVFIYRHRRRRRKEGLGGGLGGDGENGSSSPTTTTTMTISTQQQQQGGQGHYAVVEIKTKAEADAVAAALSELNGVSPPQEMADGSPWPPYEMEGTPAAAVLRKKTGAATARTEEVGR